VSFISNKDTEVLNIVCLYFGIDAYLSVLIGCMKDYSESTPQISLLGKRTDTRLWKEERHLHGGWLGGSTKGSTVKYNIYRLGCGKFVREKSEKGKNRHRDSGERL
jgi:hypothetical protein